MKLQIKTTFDFGKLAKGMPKILEKHMQRTGRSSATGAREAIDKGVSPKLKKSTIDRRKKSGTGGTKPLYETGNLYRSIKAKGDILTMNDYGIKHHKGFTTGVKSMIKKKKVSARPFIKPDEQEILTVFDGFKRDLSRNFRK